MMGICFSSTMDTLWENLEEPELNIEEFEELFSRVTAKKKVTTEKAIQRKKSKQVGNKLCIYMIP